ncbi:MAG TPA: S28 family serine protease [Kofleriaceae bacterium]|nr:S28 family serine protease [Kofleriaceae bacterium]
MRIWIPGVLVLGLLACGGSDSPPGDTPDAGDETPDANPDVDAPEGPLGDIADELRGIPGLTVEERPTTLEGYRFFVLTYDQPVDHMAPSGPRFAQRLTLLHRDYAAPVVTYNSGYNLSTRGSRSQITVLINGNQLSMEHRYFSPSRPDPADWTKLTIQQAATDQHRITQALQARIYHDNKWLTTGASKGGMTSLFHRRFFPEDVDGTVAYVAPIDYPEDAVQSDTNRYFVFLENVGTDPACRQKLKDFQNLALARREAMKTRMRAEAQYTLLGEDRALEFAVVELPFIFWQYGAQSRCGSIPGANATDDQVFAFMDDISGAASYGDEDLDAFLPYYHQSATQLGYPAGDESYLVGMLHPGEDTARAYVPSSIPTPAYDEGVAMRDIQTWLAADGAQVMLIYGQNDPWTAGAVDIGAATDSYKYIAPNGNHGSSITTLGDADETAARATVLRWAGLPTGGMMAAKARLHAGEVTAEQEELALRRHHR